MHSDTLAAYESILVVQEEMQKAIRVATDSPIPSPTWNNYGRAMELLTRIATVLKP